MLGRTVGHYRVTDRLGGGGMGVVYRAEDVKLGRTVALKFLPPELTSDPEAKLRFEREARAASKLDHPNICTIHDFGEADDGQMYLAMACYDGESLASKIADGPMPLDDALRIVEQIARGLGKAHSAGIIHRDVKPDNVMITADGVVKILDFGLAKITLASKITRSNTTVGTPAYMAPEQLRGEDVGPQADIWALGVVLFELLTGDLPFRGDYHAALSYAILNEQPASIPDQPEIDRIVKRMLRKDPLQRYQSVSELLADLAAKQAPAEHQRLKNGAKLGPYEIVKPIGSGGMGDVYLAKDTRLDRQVAIKVLAPEFSKNAERKERFKREAKTISQVTHPNICTLFDAGEQEGVDYLVMEFLEGETLAEKKTPLPIPQVLKIGEQIAEGLAAAHRQGIVHRDLKPANVMITKSGAVKLLDFGLAKDVGEITMKGSDSKPLTAEGMIVGTLPYMAPEQVEGRSTDARTDIFAFGAILYELTTGRRAFEGQTKASLIASIMTSEHKALTKLQPLAPPGLEHLVRKCLEKSPDQRFESAHDLAVELRWIGEARGEERPPALTRRPLLSAIVVAAILVAGAAIVVATFLARRLATAEQPTRSAVLLPAGVALPPLLDGAIVLSPDSRRVAMILRTKEKRELAVHDLTSGETKTLAGTETASYPFWAPDGQHIGFFADGKLKTVGANGGAVQILCDAPEGRGGSWSSRGVIVFTPGISQPLFRVSEGGGTPVAVTRPEKGWTNRNPFFLPDGKTFLYIVRGSALYAGSIDGHAEKRIIENASNAAFVNGWILFARNRNLVAQRFDAAKLIVSGTPVPIAESVDCFKPRDLANFSATSRTLLYVSAATAPRQIVSFDPATRQVEPLGQPGDYLVLDVSRDGRKLAVAVGSDPYDVWIMQLDRGMLTRATFTNAQYVSALFSPDGNRFAYGSANQDKVMIQSIDGSAAETAHDSPVLSRGTLGSWSADGQNILLTIQQNDTGYDIGYLSIPEHKLIPLLNSRADEQGPSLSPDGKWLAYNSNESGAPQVYVTAFPDLRRKWQISSDTGVFPKWSLDGRQLFFISRGKLNVVQVRRDGASPEFGAPATLPVSVDLDITPDVVGAYAVGPGPRIITTQPAGEPVPRSIHLITNWTKLLP